MGSIDYFLGCRNKPWWIMILGGVVNSCIYAVACAFFSVEPLKTAHWLLLMPYGFLLQLWIYSQTSIKRFVATTFVFVLAFFIIGIQMMINLFGWAWDIHYNGADVFGEANAEIMSTFLYQILSIIAWLKGLTRTWAAKRRNSRPYYGQCNGYNGHYR